MGFGGSPDEEAETTLDAMIMDGVRFSLLEEKDWRTCAELEGAGRGVGDDERGGGGLAQALQGGHPHGA